MTNYNSRRLKMIEAIKPTITIPIPDPKEGIEFYYPTHRGGKFVYHTQSTTETITIDNPLEAAIFLKKHEMIHTYTIGRDGEVRMYVMNTMAVESDQTVHWVDPQMVTWQSFEFTRDQALQFAAVNEIEKTQHLFGMGATVINMFKKVKIA